MVLVVLGCPCTERICTFFADCLSFLGQEGMYGISLLISCTTSLKCTWKLVLWSKNLCSSRPFYSFIIWLFKQLKGNRAVRSDEGLWPPTRDQCSTQSCGSRKKRKQDIGQGKNVLEWNNGRKPCWIQSIYISLYSVPIGFLQCRRVGGVYVIGIYFAWIFHPVNYTLLIT